MMKEATARIKINHLLEAAGWRFFDDENGSANIVLERVIGQELSFEDASKRRFA
jgi:hypothetical protein